MSRRTKNTIAGNINGQGLDSGLELGGNQEAKDARAAALKVSITTRKDMLLSNDRICSNEDINRKREENSSRFHLLPSIICSTSNFTASCQQDLSLALRRKNVAKQHITLLDSLVSSVPLRTVPATSLYDRR